jgi:hypothetical protein
MQKVVRGGGGKEEQRKRDDRNEGNRGMKRKRQAQEKAKRLGEGV